MSKNIDSGGIIFDLYGREMGNESPESTLIC